jgi:hypothetical protein
MKYVLVVACLLAGVGRAWGQSKASAPFKGANAIVISGKDGPVATLKALALEAQRKGYTIDTLTDTRLVTAPRLYDFKQRGIVTPSTHIFRALPIGADVVLTGVMSVPLRNGRRFESAMGWYSPSDESQDKACFTQAQALARACGCGPITYLQLKP